MLRTSDFLTLYKLLWSHLLKVWKEEGSISNFEEAIRRDEEWVADRFSRLHRLGTLGTWQVYAATWGSLREQKFLFTKVWLINQEDGRRFPLNVRWQPLGDPFLTGRHTRRDHAVTRRLYLEEEEYQNLVIVTRDPDHKVQILEFLLQAGIYALRYGALGDVENLLWLFRGYLQRRFPKLWRKWKELRLPQEKILGIIEEVIRSFNVPADSNTFFAYVGTKLRNLLRERGYPWTPEIARSTLYYWEKKLEKLHGRKVSIEEVEAWILQNRGNSGRVASKWGPLPRILAQREGISENAARMRLQRRAKKLARERGISVDQVRGEWLRQLRQPTHEELPKIAPYTEGMDPEIAKVYADEVRRGGQFWQTSRPYIDEGLTIG